MMVSVTTRQPSPLSGVSAAAGPRLLIRQVQYLLSSQLTFISEGSSPIRRLGTKALKDNSALYKMTDNGLLNMARHLHMIR